MSRVTINSNLAALRVGRSLASSTNSLQKSFERLSSGLRINRASDDAAGLSVAAGLDVDARVYAQGVRNFNDGISMLNIADGALSELSGIVIRIRELATQSANGSLSHTQRKALDQEAQELSEEFARIAQTAEFNDLSLLGGDVGSLRLQAGYGESGGITSSFGGAIGDRTFTSSSFTEDDDISSAIAIDVNRDGHTDLLYSDPPNDRMYTRLSNGDGTFRDGPVSFVGTAVTAMDTGDYNDDGIVDVVGTVGGPNGTRIYLGDGNGGFAEWSTVGKSPGSATSIHSGDIDGDGDLDLLIRASSTVYTRFNNGDGTFTSGNSTNFGSGYMQAADFNNDGLVDIGIVSLTDFTIHTSNGDGTYSLYNKSDLGNNSYTYEVGDLNADGILDIVVQTDGNGGTNKAFLGSSDGSYSLSQDLGTGSRNLDIEIGDFDGDGFLDVFSVNENNEQSEWAFGNGDGTFESVPSYDVGANPDLALSGDFNGDGVLDLLAVDTGADQTFLHLHNTVSGTAAIRPFSLTTRAGALDAMPILDAKLADIAGQRGSIGALISRVETGINNLGVTGTNLSAARSRITDVDVSSEAANLARVQILQQAGAAILSQANQSPALALSLLSGI